MPRPRSFWGRTFGNKNEAKGVVGAYRLGFSVGRSKSPLR
jgi:hypothetical protein